MKVKWNTATDRLERYARNIILAFAFVILGFCLVESFMHTMELRNSEEAFEGIYYHSDNFLVNAFWVVLVISLLALVLPYLERIPIGIQMGVLAAVTITLGCIWVYSSQSAPTEDSFMVSNAGKLASQGDFSFMSDTYFQEHQYQLGFVLYCEVLMRLFGQRDTLLYLEVINVIYLATGYLGMVLLLGRLFHSKRVQTIACVTLLFCLQPILFSIFIYGTLPGIIFVIYALLFEVLCFQSKTKLRWLFGALSVLFMMLAVLVKINNYICLIALAILAIVKLLQRRKLSDLCYLVVLCSLTLCVNPLVQKSYETRSGVTLGETIPMTSYAVMGLNYPENAVGCTAAGWYNGYYTIVNFESHNCDEAEASKASVEQIKERLSYFREHPTYANDFFYEKNMSQWNEPTYSGIWINIVRAKYQDVGKLATYICDTGADRATAYMNVYQLLIFLGAFVGVLCCFRKKDLLCTAFVLIVVGAFLYHMVFEGKSQYVLPYFLLLCGFSAVGTDVLTRKAQVLLHRLRDKLRRKPVKLIPDELNSEDEGSAAAPSA